MSINYTQLFTQLGSIIKVQSEFTSIQGTTLMGSGQGADSILSQFETQRGLVIGVQSEFQGWASSVESWSQSLQTVAEGVFSNLQGTLNVADSSPQSCVQALAQQMVVDGQTVLSSTVSAPTITAQATNVGTGQLIVLTSTTSSTPDQRIINEVVGVVCTSDAYSGASAGAEVFQIVGQPSQSSPFTYLPLGNGTGPNVSVADAGNNMLANALMTSSVYLGWTVTVPIEPPSAAPTVAVGGTSGLLAPGTYYIKVTEVGTGGGETTASPESTQFTITSGEVATVTFPTASPGWQSWNIYCTPVNGASGSETLYATGITASTYNMSAVAGSSSTTPPASNTAILSPSSTSSPVQVDLTDYFNATGSMGLFGSANAWSTITVEQTLTVTPSTAYYASLWVKAITVPPAGSTLTVNVGGVTLLSVAASSISTTVWTNYKAPVYTAPETSSLTFSIEITGGSTFTSGEIAISNPVLTQPVEFGYCGYVLLRGSADYRVNDKYTVQTEITSGNFQGYFATNFGVVLPNSATPTIADNLG